MNKNISKKSLQKGFTLIEMIISLAIFTVVALVAVGALVKVMDANRKSINLKIQ
jgi:prepilin-type N-terminal cleavage/methylation domain-containing protein